MGTQKKILYVHHGSGKGGAANSLLFLLQGLDRERYKPIVACDSNNLSAESFFRRNGFQVITIPMAPFVHTMKTWKLYTPRGLAKLLQWIFVKHRLASAKFDELLRSLKPDLVHLNGLSILPLSPIAKRLAIPVVQHVRESINDGLFRVRKKWLIKMASTFADHVIYICQDNRVRMTGVSSKSTVIYNPIDLDKFKNTDARRCREELGLKSDAIVLFFPGGSFLDIKGLIPFLFALSDLRKRYPCTRAIVPGLDDSAHPRDRFRRQVESIISSEGLEECILRFPFSADVEVYYAASDIVVAPFLVPHFSRAVIEAGAMSRPVVASDIGGITEVLVDGVTGLLAAPNDVDELAGRISYLIENPDQARAMGVSGHQRAKRFFDARNHVKQVMSVYDQVVT